jgi:hypothetical protein
LSERPSLIIVFEMRFSCAMMLRHGGAGVARVCGRKNEISNDFEF